MALFLWIMAVTVAPAHTLPYFSWFQVDRRIIASRMELRVTHTCHFDHQTFRVDDPLVDSDGDSTVSQRELADLCALTARYLAEDFLVVVADRPVPANLHSFAMIDNNSGFRTEMTIPVSEFHGVTPVILLDPAYLFPRPAATTAIINASTTHSVILATAEEGVSLQDDSGALVRSLESRPLFRTDLTLHLRSAADHSFPDTSATAPLSPIQSNQIPNHAPNEEASQ